MVLLLVSPSCTLPLSSPPTLPAAWRRLCSVLIRHILDSIKNSLPLNVVIETIMDDHAQEEFREFRSTILSMLDSYHYETRIQETADKLMKDHLLEYVGVLAWL